MTAFIQYFHMFLKGSFQKEIRNDLNCHLSLASQLKSYWQGWNHQSFHCCRTKNICIVFEKNSLFFNFSVIQSSNYEILRNFVWSWHTYNICAYLYYLPSLFVKNKVAWIWISNVPIVAGAATAHSSPPICAMQFENKTIVYFKIILI